MLIFKIREWQVINLPGCHGPSPQVSILKFRNINFMMVSYCETSVAVAILHGKFIKYKHFLFLTIENYSDTLQHAKFYFEEIEMQISMCLLSGWEARYDGNTRRYFFINHQTKQTQWNDPRIAIYEEQQRGVRNLK